LFIPWWVILLGVCVMSGMWFRRWFVERARMRAGLGLCSKCGYDLRATPERCPECGKIAGAT
jgi:predicted amidophosphoribosyltransferase